MVWYRTKALNDNEINQGGLIQSFSTLTLEAKR